MSNVVMDTSGEKTLLQLFCLTVTKHPDAVKAVTDVCKMSPSLLQGRLTFLTGNPVSHLCGFRPLQNSLDTGCNCDWTHESFHYISDGKLDESTFESIHQSLETGKCRHFHLLSGLAHSRPTSVNLVHAAAAVGNIPVLDILMKSVDMEPALTGTFKASPLHLAVLREQRLCIEKIISLKQESLTSYCLQVKHRRTNKTIATGSNMNLQFKSIIGLCIEMNDMETVKSILKTTRVTPEWILDVLHDESENAFQVVSPHLTANLINEIKKKDLEYTFQIYLLALKTGQGCVIHLILNHLKERQLKVKGSLSLAMIAILYNNADILELLLNTNTDDGLEKRLDKTLLDIANMLGHYDCAGVLIRYGIIGNGTPCGNKALPFMVIMELARLSHCDRKIANYLIKQIRIPVKQKTNDGETLLLYSLKHKGGLGARALLELGDDVNAVDSDGFCPLQLIMKLFLCPCLILDILYFNPVSMFYIPDRANVSILENALNRDLRNGSYEYVGSITCLLLDCGYDISRDNLFKASYLASLADPNIDSMHNSGSRNEIFLRIKKELFSPKPLKERCRNVLRRTLAGDSLHKYVSTVRMPASVKNYILMESKLKQNIGQCRKDHRRLHFCIIDQ